MSVETIKAQNEFEQNVPREVERKFLPIFPEVLDELRAESVPIEQFYLSHPSEPFSLRMRETCHQDGSVSYAATLKDRGTVTSDGLDRLEVTTPVPLELYSYYKNASTPVLRKLRAEPLPGVALDFLENGSVHLEAEDRVNWQRFVERYGDMFVNVTGDRVVDSEWQAHMGFRREHTGREALVPDAELDVDTIMRDVLAKDKSGPIVVHIGGRSGSGKSTIVRKLQAELSSYNLSSVVTSTDDYHRGTTWLRDFNGGETWMHWDDRIVYDTATMAQELEKLRAGSAIELRRIDWQVAEPIVDGVIEPAEVIIVEGIYATSPEITHDDDLSYVMTTPLATCIGRRLLRDLVERPQFADPGPSLSYMLREAEPAYRIQHNLEEN